MSTSVFVEFTLFISNITCLMKLISFPISQSEIQQFPVKNMKQQMYISVIVKKAMLNKV